MNPRVKQTHVIQVGGYSNEQNAKRELPDFRDANVFAARSAVFPNPRNFGMATTIKRAEVKEWSKNPMNSHCIEVEIEFDAPSEQTIKSWLDQTNNRLRAFAPVTLTRTGGESNAPQGR